MAQSSTSFDNGNKAAVLHGAEGTLRRFARGLPLAEDDAHLHREIINTLGYDPIQLTGALGYLVELIADNVLLAIRFKSARHWAAEQGDVEKYAALSQKSGWRNDKAIGQLLELAKLQAEDTSHIIDALKSAKDTGA